MKKPQAANVSGYEKSLLYCTIRILIISVIIHGMIGCIIWIACELIRSDTGLHSGHESNGMPLLLLLIAIIVGCNIGIGYLFYKCLLSNKRTERSIRIGIVLGIVFAAMGLLSCLLFFRTPTDFFRLVGFLLGVLCVVHIIKSSMLLKNKNVDELSKKHTYSPIKNHKKNINIKLCLYSSFVFCVVLLMPIGFIGFMLVSLLNCGFSESVCKMPIWVNFLPFILVLFVGFAIFACFYRFAFNKRKRTKRSMKTCLIFGVICACIVGSFLFSAMFSAIGSVIEVGFLFMSLGQFIVAFLVEIFFFYVCVLYVVNTIRLIKLLNKVEI